MNRILTIVLAGLVASLCALVFSQKESNAQPSVSSPPYFRFDDDLTGQVKDLTGTSVPYTLPDVKSSYYKICAFGNTAYILCGANPTATPSDGGHSLIVPEGMCTGPFMFDCVESSYGVCATRKCAAIASTVVTGARVQYLKFSVSRI